MWTSKKGDMTKAKVGIVVDARGITSVSLLGDDVSSRMESLRLYEIIGAEVENFGRRVRDRLESVPPAAPPGGVDQGS